MMISYSHGFTKDYETPYQISFSMLSYLQRFKFKHSIDLLVLKHFIFQTPDIFKRFLLYFT
jgi:hypothetical protein